MVTSMTLTEIAKKASSAALILAHLSTDEKNQALKGMAERLDENCKSILSANKTDLEFAEKEGIAKPLIARLALNEDKIYGTVYGFTYVAPYDSTIFVNTIFLYH